jgi:hypothetical protein
MEKLLQQRKIAYTAVPTKPFWRVLNSLPIIAQYHLVLSNSPETVIGIGVYDTAETVQNHLRSVVKHLENGQAYDVESLLHYVRCEIIHSPNISNTSLTRRCAFWAEDILESLSVANIKYISNEDKYGKKVLILLQNCVKNLQSNSSAQTKLDQLKQCVFNSKI